MSVTVQSWKKLGPFCLGLSIAAAFCMKWMEADFRVQGGKFTVLGLEVFYDRQKIMGLLSLISKPVKRVLYYHLCFDFVFMAGIYPCIACLCMIAGEKTVMPGIKKMLFILAALQLAAWAADIIENMYLLNWLSSPVISQDELNLYHLVVITKWVLALAGLMISLIWVFRRKPGLKRSA